jgi:hypothetical protein
MATRVSTYPAILTDYTNAEEATLATSLSGQSAGSSVIYNTDIGSARIWNGSAFESIQSTPTTLGSALQYLRVNAGGTALEYATLTGALPDLVITKYAPELDQTITAGYSAYYSGYYEIADTKFLEIGEGSTLEIG